MLPLDPHIQNCLMIVPLHSRLLQPLYFFILQPSSNNLFELFSTNLLLRLQLLAGLHSRLEARLHPYSQRGIEGYGLRIPTYFRPFNRIGYSEELLACGLDVECPWCIWGRNTEEGFLGRDGFVDGGEDAGLVAA